MASLPRPKGLQNDPPGLVNVPGGQGGKAIQVAPAVVAPLEALRQAARAAGFKAPLFDVVSAYRSSARQAELWAEALAKYGSVAEARKWVAPPGNSTHQTGYAIDFYLGTSNSSSNVDALRKTKAWRWLDANADSLGWAPYTNEPWHWEYARGGGGSGGGGGAGAALLALIAVGAAIAGIVYAQSRRAR